MRYALLADIHGNLEALESVLEAIDAEGVDEVICLGDVVGYNADAAACLARVRERCEVVIQGNHERLVADPDATGVRIETQQAAAWSRDQLSDAERDYIAALPEQARVGDHILVVHGSPRDRDEYILSTDAIRDNVAHVRRTHQAVRVCFFGHSHFPMVIGLPDVHTRFHKTRTIELDPSRIYLINPGSVGQPRDGCPDAAFAIYDTAAPRVTIHRVPYDVAAAQEKVRGAGLDERLAARLAIGR